MGTNYNNGAPVYKIEQPKYTMPDYTIDHYTAREAWNKEIANNKQGYMGVEIMSMKDFYDAGGYSFVDDYRAELGALDAAYDRALPGYGVKGEQMASAGLTGSGYGDYLSGQAYAVRAQGQALARQNIMANSNSFRAAYNSYVAQQKDKREKNLQTVIDKAYNSAMDPEMFVEMATKLGIPQADAERGKGILEGYYMGVKRNEYGLTDDEQKQASSLVNQIVQGLGTYANTDAIKNLLLATSTNKNAEAIFDAAMKQAKAGVLAELQGKIENGYGVDPDELKKLQAYYGFTDAEFEGITTGMKETEASGGGKLTPEQQTQANSYADLFNAALSEAIENNTSFSLKTILGVNHLDENDPLVKAAIDDFQSVQAGAYEEQIVQGAFVSKNVLDAAKLSRLISDEQYNTLLGSAQAKTGEKLIEAIKSDDMNKYIEVLSALGIDTTDINEDNAMETLYQVANSFYSNEDINKEARNEFVKKVYKVNIDSVSDNKDLEKVIINAAKDGLTSQDIAEMLRNVHVTTAAKEYGNTNGGTTPNGLGYMAVPYINITLENGKTAKCNYTFIASDSNQSAANKAISAKEKSSDALERPGDIVGYKDKLYVKTQTGMWKAISIDGDKNKLLEKALAEVFQYDKARGILAGASPGAIRGALG